MWTSRLIPVALLAALTAAAPAGAGTGFAGNVCRLATAKQIAALAGVSPLCTNTPSAKGPGSTIYVGSWPGKEPRSPHLQVTISVYGDPGALQLARRNLNQGLPGTPRKVSGIGSAAYEAAGASAIGIHFAVGKDVAYVTLTSTGKLPRASSLEALARAVAARL